MNNEIVFHINNMAYTISVNDELKEELLKYMDLDKNNDTKDLLAAYIRLSQEYSTFKKDVQDITNKLSRY